LAISGDQFTIFGHPDELDHVETRMPKLFEAGHTMFSAAVAGWPGTKLSELFNGVRRDCGASADPEAVVKLLLARAPNDRIAFLVAGFGRDGLAEIWRRRLGQPLDSPFDECGYVCVGAVDNAGAFPRPVYTLDEAAAYTRDVILVEIARAKSQKERCLVAEPIDTFTLTPEGLLRWTS